MAVPQEFEALLSIGCLFPSEMPQQPAVKVEFRKKHPSAAKAAFILRYLRHD
jgi:hypothetical protein